MMNVVNIEVYSTIILFIIITDYISKFKKEFTSSSMLWLTISISSSLIAISNILLSISDIYFIKLISIIIYSISTINATLFIYIYIKYKFIKPYINIRKEITIAIYTILACILLTILYIFFTNSGYVIHSFDRHFFKQLLILAIIPNITILAQYIYAMKKEKRKTNIQVLTTIILMVFGLILDAINDSLFFVSASFTFASLIIYINKYDNLINTDPLTGLSNKRVLNTFLEHLKPNINIAVYNIDINKFKLINDNYGHAIGDIALKDIALILRESSREQDLVIRNGGDEFLIVAIIKKEEDAIKIYKRILKNLENYNKNSTIKIALSIGWDIYKSLNKTSINNFELFLKTIDKKMYEEKNKGK